MKADRIILVLVLIITNLQAVFSKDEKYRVEDIPAELLVNARSVIRNEKIEFRLDSEKGAKANISYAITIMNENGEDDALFIKWYNKHRKIQNISGRVYDKNGKMVDRVRQDKIVDYSAIQNFSLFEDTRLKGYKPEYRVFPYTIEYSYSIDYRGVLNCPDWYPYRAYNISVEKSVFQIKFPADNPLRYYSRFIDECTRTVEGNDSIITWEVKNLEALRRESFSPLLMETTPAVLTAPSDFMYGGYDGNSESWEEFGEWIYSLMDGRDQLPEATRTEVRQIVAGVESTEEKIRLLYEYMQNKTRYVNIAIGIGGYQPFEASTVDELGYGDCKALSNYMLSLLKEAGIPSHYTLVNSGERAVPMIRSFPSNQFNHAILCVPIDGDTVWLECTSQRLPSGFIGDFTDNRDVLIISGEKGELARTTAYSADQNRRTRKAVVMLDESGNGDVNISTEYYGIQYGDMVPFFHEDKEDQKQALLRSINIPSFELGSFEYSETRYPDPFIRGNIKLSLRNYTSRMGNRTILPVNLLAESVMPESIENRRTNILVRREKIYTDTIVFRIPGNFAIENFSSPATIQSDFGTYKNSIFEDDGEIIFVREMKINKGKFPPDKQEDLLGFYRSVQKADKASVILVKD